MGKELSWNQEPTSFLRTTRVIAFEKEITSLVMSNLKVQKDLRSTGLRGRKAKTVGGRRREHLRELVLAVAWHWHEKVKCVEYKHLG